uniref:Artemin n=1 Tax=Malurus cyaneus samueli TaxID=2593467 RepID=A0A8C5TLC8_9PASS
MGLHAWPGQGRHVPTPSQPALFPPWALTSTSALAASMDQRQGPPESRPAGPTTHAQPKVSSGLSGCDGQDYMTALPPIPSSWSLIPGVGTLARADPGPRKPSRGTRGRNCHIRNLMVKVRDLGLGFNSDEIVLFKYCSGSCHRARSNYDLTLGSLLRQQLIAPGPQERVLSHPCCRPTRYEAVSFMDVENTWQTVEKLSAAECSCIG